GGEVAVPAALAGIVEGANPVAVQAVRFDKTGVEPLSGKRFDGVAVHLSDRADPARHGNLLRSGSIAIHRLVPQIIPHMKNESRVIVNPGTIGRAFYAYFPILLVLR